MDLHFSSPLLPFDYRLIGAAILANEKFALSCFVCQKRHEMRGEINLSMSNLDNDRRGETDIYRIVWSNVFSAFQYENIDSNSFNNITQIIRENPIVT